MTVRDRSRSIGPHPSRTGRECRRSLLDSLACPASPPARFASPAACRRLPSRRSTSRSTRPAPSRCRAPRSWPSCSTSRARGTRTAATRTRPTPRWRMRSPSWRAPRPAISPPRAWPPSTPSCSRCCRLGDEVIIPRAVYGGVVGLAQVVLAKSGIGVKAVDTTDADAVEAAIGERTRLLWVETISNPTTAMSDIAAPGRAGPRTGDRAGRRQHLRLALPGQPAGAGRRPGGASDHQVHRRPFGHHRRRGAGQRRAGRRRATDRHQRRRQRRTAGGVPGAAWPEDAGHPDGSPLGQRAGRGLRPGGRAGRGGASTIRACPRIRSTSWPRARCATAWPAAC